MQISGQITSLLLTSVSAKQVAFFLRTTIPILDLLPTMQ